MYVLVTLISYVICVCVLIANYEYIRYREKNREILIEVYNQLIILIPFLGLQFAYIF